MNEMLRFENPATLCAALAQRIQVAIASALQHRPRARLVVSGGSTPLPLFKMLSTLDCDWQQVDIALADERLVPPEHERSNERLVRQNLMQSKAACARFVQLQDIDKHWPGSPFADLVLLGMGGDGHTASLFPDAPELKTALADDADIVQILRPPSQPEQRISLSLRGLLDCRQIILHIEGEDKQRVLALAHKAGPVEALPVRALLQQARTPLSIYWAP